ncbi:transposase [Candidatus Sumerlaeota bacterium]
MKRQDTSILNNADQLAQGIEKGATTMTRRKQWKFQSEEEARKHLQLMRWGDSGPICTHCLETDYTEQSPGRYRCRRCGRRFSDYSRTWMEIPRLTHKQWLLLVDMFVRKRSAGEIGKELGTSYKSALKGLNAIRLAILDNISHPRFDFDMRTWKYCLIPRHDPNGRLRIEHGKVKQEHHVFDLSPSGCVFMSLAADIDKTLAKGGQFVSTCGGFLFPSGTAPSAIVFTCSDDLRWKYRDKILDHRDHPELMPEGGFPRFVFRRMLEHGGISPYWLPAYLMQFSFEYRNQGRAKTGTILKHLCQNPLLDRKYMKDLQQNSAVWQALKDIYPWRTLGILLGEDQQRPIRVSPVFIRKMPILRLPDLFEFGEYTPPS